MNVYVEIDVLNNKISKFAKHNQLLLADLRTVIHDPTCFRDVFKGTPFRTWGTVNFTVKPRSMAWWIRGILHTIYHKPYTHLVSGRGFPWFTDWVMITEFSFWAVIVNVISGQPYNDGSVPLLLWIFYTELFWEWPFSRRGRGRRFTSGFFPPFIEIENIISKSLKGKVEGSLKIPWAGSSI